MSGSATDSQNCSGGDDIYEDSDVSISSEENVDKSGDISGVRDDVNNEDEVNSSLHVSPEQARKAFQSIRNLYKIKIPELEIYKVDSRFYDLSGDSTSILICEGQLKAGLRLPLSKLVCDVLNYFDRCPIQMSSSFWTIMMIFEELNEHHGYNICLGDIAAYYRCVGGRSGDFVSSLNKQSRMGDGKVFNPPQSNDGWKHTTVFRVRGEFSIGYLEHLRIPTIGELAERKKYVEKVDPVSIKQFAALSWAEKRELLPNLARWFQEPKPKKSNKKPVEFLPVLTDVVEPEVTIAMAPPKKNTGENVKSTIPSKKGVGIKPSGSSGAKEI
ncbi:hypothetical protein FRX31_032110, partial [Thalictrum thalictroides]